MNKVVLLDELRDSVSLYLRLWQWLLQIEQFTDCHQRCNMNVDIFLAAVIHAQLKDVVKELGCHDVVIRRSPGKNIRDANEELCATEIESVIIWQ